MSEQVRQWLLEDLEKLISSNLVFGHRMKGPGGRNAYKPTDVVLNLHMAERLTAAAMAAHVLGNYDWPVITGGPLADQLKKDVVFEWRLPDRLDGFAWREITQEAFEAWAKTLKPGEAEGNTFTLILVRTK